MISLKASLLPLLLTLSFFSPRTAIAAPSEGGTGPSAPPFELQEGDRIIFVGDTLVEREQAYGYWEARLTAQFPGRHLTFRNLGWSADSPAGESRAGFDFDKPGKGFEKLKQQLKAARPTVAIIGYGMANSFSGPAGLQKFRQDFDRLLDAIAAANEGKPVKLVILGPIRHEDLGRPLPDPSEHNRNLEIYSAELKKIAAARHARFVSLYDFANPKKTPSLTHNGIHLSAYGYWRMADFAGLRLGWEPLPHGLSLKADSKTQSSAGTKLADIALDERGLRFTTADSHVGSFFTTGESLATGARELQISGLASGCYELRIDGTNVLSANDSDFRRGVTVAQSPEVQQADALREAIKLKNTLFFDRSRPQNETYLLGFRKQEQGQNAKEIPMFDPLIAEAEKKIHELATPRTHRYELVRVGPRRKTDEVAKAKTSGADSSHHDSAAAGPLNPKPVFEVAPGFEVSLFTESPLLAKPTQINFDPKGRLWVSSSSVYPQIQPGQTADDKILVLEDTDGDGFAEKSTVFAEGLLIPTGVVPGDGGCYVGQSTELLHFIDTDGDGKADRKEIVLSGFGTEDTHHMVHTLRWAMDGQLYFNQSIYIHTHIETPNGVEHLNSGGVWHLRPPTLELGVLLRGFCNPWGHEFDAFGQSFATDGAGGQGLSYGIPGATYFTYANMRRELRSVSPGNYPKFCGLEFVRTTQFPDDWQGNAITCDFRAHRVVRFTVEDQGAGYAAKETQDLLRTADVTFRPIDVKLGPDGALYIADWSNPIIQHGEVDFRDPRRDHEHGRIWRVTAKGRPLIPRTDLTSLSSPKLLDNLVSPSSPVSEQSRRVLTERGQKIVPDLARWTKTRTAEKDLLEALWMYQSIDVPETKLLERVLKAKDGRLRAAAVRVASYWQRHLPNVTQLLEAAINDEHPRVRLEAIRAVAAIRTTKSVDLALSALDKPMDPFIEYALWLTVNDLADVWVAAVKAGTWNSQGREKQLEFVLKAIEPSRAGMVLGEVLSTKDILKDGSGPWIGLIAAAGDGATLKRLFDQVLQNKFDANGTGKALEALNTAARERQAKPTGSLDGLAPLVKNSDPLVRQRALALAGGWKLKSFVPEAARVAADKNNPQNVRNTAFETLRELGGAEAIASLKNLGQSKTDDWTRRRAIATLAALDLKAAAPMAADWLTTATSEQEALDFWQTLLPIKGASAEMVRALPKVSLPAASARAGLRAARSGGRNEPDLVWALTRGGDLEGEAQVLSTAEMQQLAAEALKTGDPSRGETIFRRKDMACVSCHAIGGVGGKVGPDLTSIGASAQPDYLIESMLYPNRKIKEGYHSVIVGTKDGLDLSGVLVSESTDQLILRDATGKETTIAKNNIETRVTGNSLMPGGLVDPLTPAERLDLYRFLSELGKPGHFDASKGNVARSWKLFPQTLDFAQFGDEKVLQTDLNDKQWAAASSLVDGQLLKDELTGALQPVQHRDPPAIYTAARFQTAKDGKVSFDLSGVKAPLAWVDGRPCAAGESLELRQGTHTIVIKLDAKKLPDSIRLASPDVTFLN